MEKQHRLQLQHGDGWLSMGGGGLALMRVAGGGSALSPARRTAAWQGGSSVDQASWLAAVGKGDAWQGRHPIPKFSCKPLLCSNGL